MQWWPCSGASFFSIPAKLTLLNCLNTPCRFTPIYLDRSKCFAALGSNVTQQWLQEATSSSVQGWQHGQPGRRPSTLSHCHDDIRTIGGGQAGYSGNQPSSGRQLSCAVVVTWL